MEHDLGLKEKPINWTITTLGEYLDLVGGSIQTGPFGSQLHASDYVEVGTPSVMPKNISVEGISTDDIAKVSEEDMARLSKYHLEAGDIVYSRRGDVEKCALVKKNETGWLCGTGCLRIRLGDSRKRISAGFLHAYLSSPMIREWISRNAIGATMPNLNTGILRDVPLLLPSVQEAKTIGEIWGDLNAKITLNRQINQTLEKMAQTLFKSWFVDFDPVIDNALDAGFFDQGKAIPDELQARAEQRQALRNAVNEENKANAANQPHSTRTNPAVGDTLASPYKPLPDEIRQLFPNEFEESELGWVPKGWKVKMLRELSEKISKGTTPRKSDIELAIKDKKAVFFVKVKDMTDDHRVTLDSLNLIPQSVSEGVLKRSILSEGDLLLSIAGTIGRVASVEKELDGSNCNQAVAFLRPKNKQLHHFFIKQTLLSERVSRYINSNIVQAVQANFSLTNFGEIQTIMPSEQVMRQFNLLANSYYLRALSSLRQNYALIRLRDTLLPKLISGELRLDEVESTIEETITATTA